MIMGLGADTAVKKSKAGKVNPLAKAWAYLGRNPPLLTGVVLAGAGAVWYWRRKRK